MPRNRFNMLPDAQAEKVWGNVPTTPLDRLQAKVADAQEAAWEYRHTDVADAYNRQADKLEGDLAVAMGRASRPRFKKPKPPPRIKLARPLPPVMPMRPAQVRMPIVGPIVAEVLKTIVELGLWLGMLALVVVFWGTIINIVFFLLILSVFHIKKR